MTTLPFTKMHGLGNDFIVLDARAHPIPTMTAGFAAALAEEDFRVFHRRCVDGHKAERRKCSLQPCNEGCPRAFRFRQVVPEPFQYPCCDQV